MAERNVKFNIRCIYKILHLCNVTRGRGNKYIIASVSKGAVCAFYLSLFKHTNVSTAKRSTLVAALEFIWFSEILQWESYFSTLLEWIDHNCLMGLNWSWCWHRGLTWLLRKIGRFFLFFLNMTSKLEKGCELDEVKKPTLWSQWLAGVTGIFTIFFSSFYW